MTRKELARVLSSDFGLKPAEGKRLVDIAWDSVGKPLQNGRRVRLTGLRGGTGEKLELTLRPGRILKKAKKK